MKRPNFIHPNYLWFRGGSVEICDPPPKDTDEDYFVFCPAGGLTLVRHLRSYGFYEEGEDYDGVSGFRSYRKDNLNVIVVHTRTHFGAIKEATKLCKELNLKNKKERIIVHEFMKRLFEE